MTNLNCRNCGHILAGYNMSNTHVGYCSACKPDEKGKEYLRSKVSESFMATDEEYYKARKTVLRGCSPNTTKEMSEQNEKIDLTGKPLTLKNLEDARESLMKRTRTDQLNETKRFEERVLVNYRRDISIPTGRNLFENTIKADLRSYKKPVKPPTMQDIKEIGAGLCAVSQIRLKVDGKEIGKIAGLSITQSMDSKEDLVEITTEEVVAFKKAKAALDRADFDIVDRTPADKCGEVDYPWIESWWKDKPIGKGVPVVGVSDFGKQSDHPIGIAASGPDVNGVVNVITESPDPIFDVAMHGPYNLGPKSIDRVLEGPCTVVTCRVRER